MVVVILVGLGICLSWLMIKILGRLWRPTGPEVAAMQEKVLRFSRAITSEHIHALYIKSRQLVSVDSYGRRDIGKYYSEIEYFIKEVIFNDYRILALLRENKNLADTVIDGIFDRTSGSLFSVLGSEIVKAVDLYADTVDTNEFNLAQINPIEFEILCQHKMNNAGWDSEMTKASGDQGADVVCKKNGRGLVLQCKLYSSPIGNKAVQEAFSAKQFYGLDHAAVVSNQTYTKSAQELSNMTGVLLLHYQDLDQIDHLLATA